MEIFAREDDLEALNAFLARVPEGPRTFVLEGEPGIGKTTLWAAGVEAAAELGYQVLACRPVGSEVQLSYAALGDLLDEVLDDALADLPAPRRRALEVALLLDPRTDADAVWSGRSRPRARDQASQSQLASRAR